MRGLQFVEKHFIEDAHVGRMLASCLIASINMRSIVHDLVSLDLRFHTFFN
jgi:hypothetical protein